MLYIEKQLRKKIDNPELYKRFMEMSYNDFIGGLGYLIYKIVMMWLRRNGKKCFYIPGILGSISEVKGEIRRRMLLPCAKNRKVENGDI